MKILLKFVFGDLLCNEKFIFLDLEKSPLSIENGKDANKDQLLPSFSGEELSKTFQKEFESQKRLDSNGELTSKDVWKKVEAIRIQEEFRSLYKISKEKELTKEQLQQLQEFESFIEATELVAFKEQKSVEHLFKEKLSPVEQKKFFHTVKSLKIEKELLKNSDIRAELEKKEFDTKSFNEAFQKYVEENDEFREFYKEYVTEEKEIQKSNDEKLKEFQSSVTQVNGDLEKSALLLSDQILGIGGTLGITSVRSYKGGVALFAHDKVPEGGTVPLLIYVNQSGQWNIEGDRGVAEEPFDPNKQGDFELALKNMRYRSMAIYASQQMNVLQNFDENISTAMLRSLVLYFEKDTRGSISSEGKFVILCKKWGKDKKVQEMGLGRLMKYKLFNDSEILNQIAIKEAQEEIFQILKDGENESIPGETGTTGDAPETGIVVEKPEGQI
jgi:hypothetical protein